MTIWSEGCSLDGGSEIATLLVDEVTSNWKLSHRNVPGFSAKAANEIFKKSKKNNFSNTILMIFQNSGLHFSSKIEQHCWRAQRPSVSSNEYAIYVHLSGEMRAGHSERGANLLLQVNNENWGTQPSDIVRSPVGLSIFHYTAYYWEINKMTMSS